MTELFENFEINREPRWPRVARTALLSVALHGSFIPFLIYAPTVRALWQLRSMITGAEYGEEDYALGDVRERAVMIGPASEKLYYPPGYFAKNAPPAADAQVVEEKGPISELNIPQSQFEALICAALE